MADKCVIFFSDNAAVVDIINTIMVFLSDLVLSCLRHNILFQARHIPGFNNSRADHLSRSQVTKLQQTTSNRPFDIILPREVSQPFCPVAALLQYCSTRGDRPGPHF